jgi:hypothetical protein
MRHTTGAGHSFHGNARLPALVLHAGSVNRHHPILDTLAKGKGPDLPGLPIPIPIIEAFHFAAVNFSGLFLNSSMQSLQQK